MSLPKIEDAPEYTFGPPPAPKYSFSKPPVPARAEPAEPTFPPAVTPYQLPSDSPAALARPTMEMPSPADPKAIFDQIEKREAELKKQNIDPRNDPEWRNLAKQKAQAQAANIHEAAGFIGPSEAGIAGLVAKGAAPSTLKNVVKVAEEPIRKGLQWLWEMEPEAATQALDLSEQGYRVGPGAYLKSARLQRNVDLARQLNYDPLAESAGRMAKEQTQKVFERGGMTPAESAAEIARLRNMAGVDYEKAGAAMKDSATADYNRLKGDLATRIATIRDEAMKRGTAAARTEYEVRAMLDKGVKELDQKMDALLAEDWKKVQALQSAGDLKGLDKILQEKLWGMHNDIVQHAATRYNLVKSIGGDIPVSTKEGIEAADAFLADVPEEFQKNMPALNRMITEFKKGQLPLSDLHFLRSMLRDLGNVNAEKMAPSFRNGPYKYFSSVVDDLIHQEPVGERAALAVKALDSADEWYASQSKILRNDLMQQLVDRAKKGFDVDPKAIARMVVQGTKEDQGLLRQIIDTATPEVRLKIAAADYRDVMDSAMSLKTGQLDAMKLYEQINARKLNGSLDVLWGKEGQEALDLARKLAGRAGDITVPAVPAGTFRQVLEQANALADEAERLAKQDPEKIIDAYVKQGESQVREAKRATAEARSQDILRPLSSPQLMPASAARFMLERENLPRLRAAIERWGEDSEAVKLLRQTAMEDVFKKAVTKGQEFDAVASFAKMPEAQQKLLFPNGLDQDVRKVMENVSFIYGHSTKGMPGFAAGEIMDSSLKRYLGVYAARRFAAYVVTHPRFTRFIAGNLKAGGENAREARMAMRKIMAGMMTTAIPTAEAVRQMQAPAQSEPEQKFVPWQERYAQ